MSSMWKLLSVLHDDSYFPFFKINIYLHHVPLHGNTTCSSVHVIHCLFFWSVIGTTSRDL